MSTGKYPRKNKGFSLSTEDGGAALHLHPQQVFSTPLPHTLIRKGRAWLALPKTDLSPISAALAVDKMMVN